MQSDAIRYNHRHSEAMNDTHLLQGEERMDEWQRTPRTPAQAPPRSPSVAHSYLWVFGAVMSTRMLSAAPITLRYSFVPTHPVIRGHQRSSEVIRGHQRSSAVIRGHQRSSEVIKGHQRSSEVIKGHQRSSVVIICNHSYRRIPSGRPTEATRAIP